MGICDKLGRAKLLYPVRNINKADRHTRVSSQTHAGARVWIAYTKTEINKSQKSEAGEAFDLSIFPLRVGRQLLLALPGLQSLPNWKVGTAGWSCLLYQVFSRCQTGRSELLAGLACSSARGLLPVLFGACSFLVFLLS